MTFRAHLTPLTSLSIAVIFVLLWISTIILISIRQPYTGLMLGTQQQSVVITGITTTTTGLSEEMIGQKIIRITTPEQTIELEAVDLTIEPDSTMLTYADYHRFLQRQQLISEILSQARFTLTTENGKSYQVEPDHKRPVYTLGSAFWVQLIVGVIAWLISAAVYTFRSNEIAARYLLFSGFTTLLFSTCASIYTTRELALPAILFQSLSDLNFLGGSLFIASFVSLLLYYPRRIAPTWLGLGVIGLFVAWFIAQQIGLFESMTFARRFLVMIGLFSSFILAAIHWWFSKTLPIERAALQWFLLSWLLGTSLFVLFILLPTLFGFDTSALQGYAFSLFLLVYIGLAFGILRYRLFELGVWWGRIILLLITILFLLLLDIIFISLLNLSPNTSLTLALVICGLLWLPLRALILEKILGHLTPTNDIKLRQVIDIALASAHQDQQQLWQDFLQQHFQVLNVEVGQSTNEVRLHDQGLQLLIPAIHQLQAITLSYAGQGRRLFSQRDVNVASELYEILDYAIQARNAFAAGVIEERQRISRELHDNIGSQLINALHSEQPQRKNDMIRNTLHDLRGIINHTMQGDQCLDVLFASIRMEVTDRLQIAGLQCEWSITGYTAQCISPTLVHGLRSILREAINNIIRHARAQKAEIRIKVNPQHIHVEIQDDGAGLPEDAFGKGQGLNNMKTRVNLLGGKISFNPQEHGLLISIYLPLEDIRSV